MGCYQSPILGKETEAPKETPQPRDNLLQEEKIRPQAKIELGPSALEAGTLPLRHPSPQARVWVHASLALQDPQLDPLQNGYHK